MKARITVIAMLIFTISLFHLLVGMKPVIDPTPTRLTFKET